MAVQELFIAASMPVLKLLLVTAVGSFLATDRANVLGEDARKHLNEVIFFVFSPSLVGSSLAVTITYGTFIKLWFMPFNIFLTFVIGSLFGWLIIQFTSPPQHLRSLIIGCCSAGNLGYVFLIIIPTVCKEKGSPFGDADICRALGVAYSSLSMAIGAVFLWGYVYNIMRISSATRSAVTESKEPLLISGTKPPAIVVRSSHERESELGTESVGKMLLRKINLRAIFAPSTTAAMIGFTVALVPWIRRSMVGGDAPLRVLVETASMLGDGAIPAVTLIMGGNLLKGVRGGSGVGKRIVLSFILVRYVALPLCGILIVKGAVRFGLVGRDPLYQFILLLQFAVPPAMNIATITQRFGVGQTESSLLMFWAYSLASISITLWSTFFMWLLSNQY